MERIIIQKDDQNFIPTFVKKLNKLFNAPKYDSKDKYKLILLENGTEYKLDIKNLYYEKPQGKLKEVSIARIIFDTNSSEGKFLTGDKDSSTPLIIKYNEKENDFRIYVAISFTTKYAAVNKIPFIDIKLDDKTEKKIANLRESKMYSIDSLEQKKRITIRDIFGQGEGEWTNLMRLHELEDDPKNFRYYLNLRGFLLFLLGSNGVSNITINKIIKVLTENKFTKADYPFLYEYHILDEAAGNDFKIRLLKQIAFAAQHMLISEEDNFLRYWITTQFHSMINWYFQWQMAFEILTLEFYRDKKITFDFFKKWLNDYDQRMLEYSLKYIEGQLEYIKIRLELKHQIPT